MTAGLSSANRICLDCGYPLKRLRENRCPECGRQFSPQDPTTFAVGRRMTRGWMIATWFVWLYPVLWLVYAHLVWIVAWAFIGHMPRWSLDDPKQISPIVSLLCGVAMITLVGVPIAPLIGIIATVRYYRLRRARTGLGILIQSGVIAIWFGVIVLARVDPLGAVDWLFD